MALKVFLKRAALWFGLAVLGLFLFRSPDLAGHLLDKAINAVISAIDSGARVLEGIAK